MATDSGTAAYMNAVFAIVEMEKKEFLAEVSPVVFRNCTECTIMMRRLTPTHNIFH